MIVDAWNLTKTAATRHLICFKNTQEVLANEAIT